MQTGQLTATNTSAIYKIKPVSFHTEVGKPKHPAGKAAPVPSAILLEGMGTR